MEARIDMITLAVADLERALDFYRDGLGLESRGVVATEFVGNDVEPACSCAGSFAPRTRWSGGSRM